MFWALTLATMAFRRHCLTPAVKSWVFGVCQELVGRETPSSKQSLYPPTCTTRLPLKAFRREPAISGFDRLFTPYPQVIQTSCDMNWCGLPSHFRGTSPCSWVAHPVSGLVHATIYALFGLAFAMAPGKTPLAKPHTANSLAHYAKGSRSRPAARCGQLA